MATRTLNTTVLPASAAAPGSSQLVEKLKRDPSTGLGLAQAFRSGGGGVGPNHDPNAPAQDCMCCAPKTLTEMAEEQDRKMRRDGTANRNGPRIQVLMAILALLALGIRWRKGFAKL